MENDHYFERRDTFVRTKFKVINLTLLICFAFVFFVKFSELKSELINTLSAVSLMLIPILALVTFFIRCSFCRKGWFEMSFSPKFGKVNFYPTDLPQNCPNCDAEFK